MASERKMHAASTDVNIQDQTTPPFDFFFTQVKAPPTTVAVDCAIGDYDVTLSSATSFAIGDYYGMFNSDNVDDNRYYFAEILNIVANVITLDTPIDFAYKIGDTAAAFSRDLSVDGSITPQVFKIEVGGNATQSIDITRLMINMLSDSAVSLATFGDLPRLTNGCVLRRINGDVRNIWNVKSNGEISNLCFDYNPYVASNPSQGQNGVNFRYTFAGQDKHGVVIRLNKGDALELVIQDDLSDLQSFRIIAEGHLVDY